jgi:hypothetical protein
MVVFDDKVYLPEGTEVFVEPVVSIGASGKRFQQLIGGKVKSSTVQAAQPARRKKQRKK